MALQFIIGRSGSGKTHKIYEDLIREAMEHRDKSYFFIVPEQYTLQTQKDIVKKHPNHGTMNIDIVSFERLAYRIFEELSYFPKAVLEDMGKRMVLRKILEEKKDQLKIFGNSIRKMGFIEEMKSMISELYQYKITPEKLEESKGAASERLDYKLQDLAFIETKFQDFMQDHFIVAEQLLEELSKKIGDSKKLRESVIYIDGFTGFTPVQNQLLGEILKYAKKVVVSVTADSFLEQRRFVQEYELFSMSNKTVYQLKELAKEVGAEILPTIKLNGDTVYRLREKEDLAALERGIFGYPIKEYTGKIEHISLTAAKDCLEEARIICEQIERDVRYKKYRYRDIAILVGDMGAYGSHFEQCFLELGIPYFMDDNKSILNNPCVESIRGILQIVEENFSYESVFRYLKAGFSKLTPKQVDALENYVIAKGIRSKKKWTQAFVTPMYGQSEQALAELNASREQFLQEVFGFYKSCKQRGRTVRDHMTALFEFLRNVKMEEKLEAMRAKFEEEGNYVQEKTYRQIYPYVISLIEKTVEILGSEKMPMKELRNILETGLEEMRIGVIPPGIDQVVVGDLTRTRLNEIKVLYFAGMNEGNIPKVAGNGGILNDYEREQLEKTGITLSDTMIQSAYTEQFYLYLAVSKPTEHLYLSYATMADQGTSMRPSYFIQRIQKVLPGLKVRNVASSGYFTEDYGMHQFIRGLQKTVEGKEPEDFEVLGRSLAKTRSLKPYIDAAYYRNEETTLSKEAAKEVYGTVLQNSVSRLEQFEACAYSHFLRYGLKLDGRQQFKIQPVDLGNIFHRSIEFISNQIQTVYGSWQDISEQEQTVLTNRAVERAVSEWNEELLDSSSRNQYMVHTIKRMTGRTLQTLLKHLEESDFKPYAFEVSFSAYQDLNSANMELDHDTKMHLTGKIDRIDRYEDENAIYLKVIDYKSGYAKFDLTGLYYGLQMQLALYMNAAVEIERKMSNGKPVIPAGMFYYSIKDPIVEVEKSQTAEESKLKELRMDGYANEDKNIIYHMERSIENAALSIPVSFTKSGKFSAYAKVMDTKTFENVQKFTMDKIKELGNEMMGGEIGIHPYQRKKKTACDFCEYREVCYFDPRINAYRKLEEKKDKELLEMWKGEEEDGMDEKTTGSH